MKRQVTASAVISGTRNNDGRAGRAGTRAPTGFASNTHRQANGGRPNLALASVKRWTHTLVLTGALNHRSAHTLEAEIERLCDEGVTGIALDLRKLTQIDSIGVAAIAFLCGLCQRRGYDFTLIAGPGRIHDAFERAGLAALLPFEEQLSPSVSARPHAAAGRPERPKAPAG
jgi:anti-anti-sigma factor